MSESYRIIRLYEGKAPGSEHWTHHEQENYSQPWQTEIVFNVTDPTLTVVPADPALANGTAVVICPGGGFHALSINSEGFDVARWLSAKGVTGFVLKYRLVECKTDDPATEMNAKGGPRDDAQAVIPLAHADGLAAMSYVRGHAQEYGIQPDRIGIIGFSAGGTVAGSVAYSHTPESRPDFAAPIYLGYRGALKDSPVPADAPPVFLCAATDDELGLATSSVEFYTDWTAAGKSAELHLYSTGGHGFGMRTQNLPSDRWIERYADWLGVLGLL